MFCISIDKLFVFLEAPLLQEGSDYHTSEALDVSSLSTSKFCLKEIWIFVFLKICLRI